MTMHAYTHCRFCGAQLANAQNARKAYCDSHCQKMGAKYGTYRNMKAGIELDPTRNRKTPRRQRNHKPLREVNYAIVEANDGNVYRQFVLELDYPASVPPLVLTGGAIPPKKEEQCD